MINKVEAIGISLSIGAMVLALWLLRVNTTNNILSTIETDNQTGAVYVANSNSSKRADVADAFIKASGGDANLEQIIIDDVTVGEGEVVKSGDVVSVNYIGTLQNGQEFDNSYKRGAPFTFTVGEGKVIAGWEQGVTGMKVGGQRILVIPPKLAYGKKGFGPIPKNATLVFAIELLSINE